MRVIRVRFGGGRALTAIVLWGLAVARAQGPIDPTIGLSNLVFDVAYYKKANPDLANLSDADAQTNWLNSGANQGRRAHPLFWSKQYLAYYPDLTAAYGATNYTQAIAHYVDTGHDEGRTGVLALASEVFNVAYYKSVNPDLAAMSDADAETHWIEHGISENRQSNPRFYARDYLFLNYDKTLLYGANGVAAAIDDFALKGSRDYQYTFGGSARIGLDALSPLVFDPVYYMNQHPEQNFQSADDATSFWLQTGLARGDKGSNVFSAREYLEQYPDLVKAFGATNYAAALDHYVRTGRREGRKGLFAIDQSYLSHVPTSAGITTKPADRVETFTSVTGQTITIVIQAPAPATNTTYSMRPINPGELPDTYFPLAVNNAIAAKAATLLIPKGVYNFQGSDAVFQHWTIDGLTDMTIDGQGSTLNFSKVEFGIFINNVNRVVLRNFVLDWPSLKMFALGKIVAGPNGQNQLQIDPAYPDDGSKAIEAISLWDDVNNTWSRQSPIDEYYGAPVFSDVPPPAYQGNQIYTSSTLADYKVGMAVLVRYYYGEGTAMVIAASNDLALENVTVHSAPGLGFFFFGGRGFRLSGCVVDRVNGRPISVTSGGLQFNNNQGDVLIENSVFAYHGDDGINLGPSSLFPVQTVNGNNLTLGSSDSTPQAGDAVYIFNSAWGLLGFSSLQSVAPDAGGGFDVQLSQAVPHLAADSWVGELNAIGARWIIRNNQFLNCHCRAILSTSPYGLIENNVMKGQTLAAILAGDINDVAPAAGPGVQDMQILNNLISDSGPMSAAPWILRGWTSPGAIMIITYLTNGQYDESGSSDAPVNQHIVLSGNTVQNVPGPAFFIGSANQVTMTGNQVINANSGPFYYLGTASTAGSVVVSQARDVDISGTILMGGKTGPVSIDRQSTGAVTVQNTSSSP